MRGLIVRFGSVACLAAMMSGCLHPDYSELPPDYSPRYTSITILTPSGKEKRVMVPEACLTPEKISPAEMGPARLAPGCANNWNTMRMAERKGDLVRGRKLGPAAGVTTARAAQRYLDGKDTALGGGVDGSSSTAPAAGSTQVETTSAR